MRLPREKQYANIPMTFRELVRSTLKDNNEVGCVLLVATILVLILGYAAVASRYGT
jgi:hypothetical protein